MLNVGEHTAVRIVARRAVSRMSRRFLPSVKKQSWNNDYLYN